MKHITLLVPPGRNNLSTVTCIAGAYDILSAANSYAKRNSRKQFSIDLAGVTPKVEFGSGQFSVAPGRLLSSIKKTDLIIIPPVNHQHALADKETGVITEWIRDQYAAGAEIASMCSGAFLLAASGLVDGKNCSLHWAHGDSFRSLFPKVKAQPEKLITDENGIYTNGGAYSFLNLLIYLVEKYYDRQTAIYCAKIFQIELDRNSQSAFAIFTGQKLHGDDMVEQAQLYLELNFQEKISVEQLSTRFAVGRRNFDRRFIKATGNTPIEYLQKLKIESAKKAFENSRKNINEVMYEVGYSDVKAFRDVFRKITGMSPLEYKGKYNKEMAAS